MEENYEDTLGRSVDLTNRKEIADYLNDETISFLSQLDDIWNQIGIDGEDRRERGFRVIQHVKNLLGDMLKEASDLRNTYADTIQSLLQQFSELGKELRVDFNHEIKGYETMDLFTVMTNLKEQIKKYENIHTVILKEVTELNEKSKLLFAKLGKKEKFISASPIPSQEEIDSYRNYIKELQLEVRKREDLFSKTKLEIIKLVQDLKVKASLDFEKSVLKETESTFVLSDDNMQRLQKWFDSLKNQQKDVESKVADLREKITMYWDRLDKPLQERNSFLDMYPGSNLIAYHALKEEESRCKEEINCNIKMVVNKTRHEIENWWEKCYYGDEEKKEFIHFDSDCYTEDLLTLHEIYVDKLKNLFDNNKEIFDLVNQRLELWERLHELEKRSNHPDRLKNRGGQLLREEKERNSVRDRLPKVEKKILTLIENYEKQHGKTLTILGQDMADIIEYDWSEFYENRNTKLSAKKQARELQKTPSKSRVLSVNTPRNTPGNTPRTPRSPKRKIAVELFECSAKKTKATPKRAPKITINKRVSLERRKRFESKRPSFGKTKNNSKLSTDTDYHKFERDIVSRSTLQVPDQMPMPNNNNAGTSRRTPLRRTPSRTDLRSRSPSNGTHRLTPAPGTLPIII